MNCLFYLTYVFKKVYRALTAPKIKLLLYGPNMILVDKDYDMKINCNETNEVTVQTLMREMFPSLVNSDLGHEFYFCHRLDYATSGVMCIPTNLNTCRLVCDAFALRRVRKYYIAIVRGLPSQDLLDYEMPIGDDQREATFYKMCTVHSPYCVNPRNARTIFLVLEEGIYNGYPAAKLLVRPVTGRRHQIRIHLSSLGHTIVGDYTYSNKKDNDPYRMYLHSYRLMLMIATEFIDVSTSEPFQNDRDWLCTKVINTLDESAYDKIEEKL